MGSPEAVELREIMRRANIPARAMATPIVEGIGVVRRLIKDVSGYRALRVHRRCVHLLAELKGGYQYAPGNATHDHETPLDRDNHGVDALRYWAWMRARRT